MYLSVRRSERGKMMKINLKKTAAVLLGSFLIGTVGTPVFSIYAKPSKGREVYIREQFAPFIKVIEENYYKDVDTEKLLKKVLEKATDKSDIEKLFRDFVSKIGDPYAAFFTKEELDRFNTSMEGSFYGIGVSVQKKKNGEVLITDVFDKSPAKEAGLKPNDIIFKVRNKKVTKMQLNDVIKLIKGKEGTKVRIDIKRGKKNEIFFVERREVIFPSVYDEFYKKDKIGYIKVTEFNSNTDELFSEALTKLEDKGAKGFVFDLRDNGGGYVDTAANMISRVIPNDKIMYSYKFKDGYIQDFRSYPNKGMDEVVDLPIVILINRNSASASEIFTGALKDHNYAVVIGEKSFGKGVAQSIYENNIGELKGGLKITILDYLLPEGESIHKKGISPTKFVKNKKDKKGQWVDTQLIEAKNEIKKKLKN